MKRSLLITILMIACILSGSWPAGAQLKSGLSTSPLRTDDADPCSGIVGSFTETFDTQSPTKNCWKVAGEGESWYLTSDPDYVRSGDGSVFHSDDSGPQDIWLISPPIELEANKSYRLEFWSYNRYPDYYGDGAKNSVCISYDSDEISSFTKLWSADKVSEKWTDTNLFIGTTSDEVIYIAFRYEGDNSHCWYLDDISLTEAPVKDIAIREILSPRSGLLLSNEEVKIKVRNRGNQILTNIPVEYSLDNGSSWISETIPGPIATGEATEYTFSAVADLSEVTSHYIQVRTGLSGDEDTSNDFLEKEVKNYGNNIFMGELPDVTILNNMDYWFFDEGGIGDYVGLNGVTQTITLYPKNPGDFVSVTFEEFRLHGGNSIYPDLLIVYEGKTVAPGNLLATLKGDLSDDLPDFISSNALTFVFYKQSNASHTGWKARVNSHTPPQHDIAIKILKPRDKDDKVVNGQISIKATNKGSETITSFTAKYQLNNETIVEETKDIDIPSMKTAEFTLATPFPRLPGTDNYTLSVWLELAGEDPSTESDNEQTVTFNLPRPVKTNSFSEKFEGNLLPQGWNVSGNGYVEIATGSFGASSIKNAREGNKNLRLMYASLIEPVVTETALVELPCMDITDMVDPVLSFWHAQEPWGGDQDVLRVLYKTSFNGSWSELAVYDQAVNQWTQRIIPLPDPGEEYYIAFEGSLNYGYGILIDDLKIYGETATEPGTESYHTVSVDVIEGIKANYINGRHYVEAGDHLQLIFSIDNPEWTADDIRLLVDGKETPFREFAVEIYTYTLNPVEKDHTLQVILREDYDPTHNTAIVRTTLHTTPGNLTVESSAPVRVVIYNATGKPVAAHTCRGHLSVALPTGIYLVKIEEEVHKISIH